MDRTLLSTLLAGLIGGVAGALLVGVLRPQSPLPDASSSSVDETVLARALEAALSRSLETFWISRRAPGPQVATTETASTGPAPAAEQDAAARARTTPAAHTSVEHVTVPLDAGARGVAPVHADRLRELRGWGEDVSIRRSWLFVSERDAFDWFGMPDEVLSGDGDEEHWSYEIAAKNPDERDEYVLTFKSGRLVTVDAPDLD